MNIQVLIPVRPFEDGKQRLRQVLSPQDRQALNAWFLNHTISVVTSVVPAEFCTVISASREILGNAEAYGLGTIREHAAGDLCAALSLGATQARQRGADGVLSISCDLPFLGPEDITTLISAAEPDKVTIAPDENKTGTNALLISPPQAIPYHYGETSFDKHICAAESAGLTTQTIDRPGLARDIDTSQDLEAYFSLASCWPAVLPSQTNISIKKKDSVDDTQSNQLV